MIYYDNDKRRQKDIVVVNVDIKNILSGQFKVDSEFRKVHLILYLFFSLTWHSSPCNITYIFILVDFRNVPNLEIYSNLNIQVPHISLIGGESEDPGEFLPLGAGQVVLQVEHGLLPVSVRGLGGRGEANPLVTVRELDIEERHECLQSKWVQY